MISFDNYANGNKTKRSLKWPYVSDHPYRIWIIGGSGSGKTNALLSLINNQSDIDKIYLYEKGLYEAKYQYLIRELQQIALNHSSEIDFKNFIKIYEKCTAQPYSF